MKHSDGQFLRQANLTGNMCGLLMSTVVGVTSRLTTGHSGPGLNAISHIFWGAKAAQQSAWTLRYTGTGLLLNQGACLFWAGCYEAFLRRQRPEGLTRSIAGAITMASVAYLVDYHVIPKRLTPGFELVFPGRLFPVLYAGLAVSLLAGATLGRQRPRFSVENASLSAAHVPET
ncbi:MAG: uncharacterized protein K0S45_1192 [Nitrospira sp.]|jgi:hypothetical protein|nr:uncharacterized protein [Nitrospira sp.]